MAFTEFVMEPEEELDIDSGDLDASTRGVGQLISVLAGYVHI